MTPIPRTVMAPARRQHGLVTRTQLHDAGVTPHLRGRLIAAGTLVPVAQGLYRLASHEVTFDQRCLSACLTVPGGALSGPTAGRIYGLRKVHTDDVHVISRSTVNALGVVGHRTNLLSPSDVVLRGQLRLLRPARLVCDLAAHLDDGDLESVVEQVLERRLASLSAIRSVGADFARSGRNGARRLSRVLAARNDAELPVESDLELQLHRALSEAGIRLVRQHRLELDSGERVRIDLADPELGLAVEVDHATWHGGRLEVERDKRRDRMLMRMGWTVPRVTDDDIRHRLRQTVDQIAAIVSTLRQAA